MTGGDYTELRPGHGPGYRLGMNSGTSSSDEEAD